MGLHIFGIKPLMRYIWMILYYEQNPLGQYNTDQNSEKFNHCHSVSMGPTNG